MATAAQQPDASDSELTEPDTPVVKRAGRHLIRSYAIADMSKTRNQEQLNDDGEYEPTTEGERDDNGEVDDDPTPKKKVRAEKVPMRLAIQASCKELDASRAGSEVSG